MNLCFAAKRKSSRRSFTKGLPQRTISRGGGTAVLQVEVSDPDLPVVWFKDGTPITQGGRYELRDEETLHTFSIIDVTPADSGEYMAKAADDVTMTTLVVEGMSP